MGGCSLLCYRLQNRCSAAELSRLNYLSINCLRWNLLWIDRCNAYQKTTNKRPSNAINTSIVPRLNPSANTKLRRTRVRNESGTSFPSYEPFNAEMVSSPIVWTVGPRDGSDRRSMSTQPENRRWNRHGRLPKPSRHVEWIPPV